MSDVGHQATPPGSLGNALCEECRSHWPGGGPPVTQTDADGNVVWEGHEPDDGEVCPHGVRIGVYCIKCDWDSAMEADTDE